MKDDVIYCNTFWNNIDWSCYSTDGTEIRTSFCPELGKKNAEEYRGLCPSHVQEPLGKTLNVSFIGVPPYVIYNPIGGTEFVITEILSKKFGFIPNFIPARSTDTIKGNQTTYGMVQQVIVFSKMKAKLLQINKKGEFLWNTPWLRVITF